MKKIRTIRELLIILLEFYKSCDNRQQYGLCYCVSALGYYRSALGNSPSHPLTPKLISDKEAVILLNFIYLNRPKKGKKFFCYKNVNSVYYWPLDMKYAKIRIAWLEYHINKLS